MAASRNADVTKNKFKNRVFPPLYATDEKEGRGKGRKKPYF
jgi:hypothetical protein